MRMNLVFDLTDEKFLENLEVQIEGILGKIIAEKANDLMTEILGKKLGRLDDKKIDSMVLAEIREIVRKAFIRPGFDRPSEFEKVLLQATKEQLKEAIAQTRGGL